MLVYQRVTVAKLWLFSTFWCSKHLKAIRMLWRTFSSWTWITRGLLLQSFFDGCCWKWPANTMRADIFWALISKLKPSFVVGHRIFVSVIHLKHIYIYTVYIYIYPHCPSLSTIVSRSFQILSPSPTSSMSNSRYSLSIHHYRHNILIQYPLVN